MLGSITIQLDSVVAWLMVILMVVTLVRFIRRRDKRLAEEGRKRRKDELLRHKQDEQKNLTGRIKNLLKSRPGLIVKSWPLNEGFYIDVTRKGFTPPDDLVFGVFVNLVDEVNSGHIYLRSWPDGAAEWFKSDEEDLERLTQAFDEHLASLNHVRA